MSANGWLVRARVARYGVALDNRPRHLLRPGCFARSLAQRFPPLLWQHASAESIGVAVDYDDHRDALDMTFEIFRGSVGSIMVELMRDRGEAEFSVGFESDPRAGAEIKHATLKEVSYVARGACPGTRLLGIEPAPARREARTEIEREADEVLECIEARLGRRREYDPAEFWARAR